MSEEVAINFNKFGTVQALYDEEAPIGFLGKQEIERLTIIEWDEHNQKWGVSGAKVFKELYYFKSRKRAIEFERAWYYQSMSMGYMTLDYVMGNALYEQYKDC